MQDGQKDYGECNEDGGTVFAADADRPVHIDDPFARQLMTRYLTRRESDLVTLRRAVVDEDFELIERTGHNLYGSGSAYGLNVVSSLGACIEIAARRRDSGHVSRLIDDLENFLRHLKIV